MQIGFAQKDITPYGNAFGSYRLSGVKRHSGIHDPLFAHALVIRDGGHVCLLVSLDVSMFSKRQADEMKGYLAGAVGIDPDAILIAATHTHNGPETLNEEDDLRITIWQDIRRAVVAAATEALERLDDARVSWAQRDLPIATNRYQYRLGQTGNTIDPRLDALIFESQTGKHFGVLYHYAAHPTCAMAAEQKVSGDYCGLADRIIEQRTGGFSMFFNGACGNVNLEVGERTFERAQKRAEEVAGVVMTALEGPKTPIERGLAWGNGVVQVGIKRDLANLDIPTDLEEQKAVLERVRASEWETVIADPKRQQKLFRQYQVYRMALWRRLLLERYAGWPTEDLPLQCVRIGSVVLVAVPGELFIEHQLRLQEQFPERRVMIVGYANGFFGYIPTAEAMTAPTYETQASLMHRVDGQAGDRLMTVAVEMIRADGFYGGT